MKETAKIAAGAKTLSTIRAFLAQEKTIIRLAETFKVMGEPLRLKIIYALLHMELCVSDLSELLGARESNVSQQLRILRALHLVKFRRDGKQSYYSLDDDHIECIFQDGLHHVQEKLAAEEHRPRL